MNINDRLNAESILLGSLWIDWKNEYIDNIREDIFSTNEHRKLFNMLYQNPTIRADFILLKLKLTEEKEYFPIAKKLIDYSIMVSCVEQTTDYIKLLEDSKPKDEIFELVNKDDGNLSSIDLEIIHKLSEKKEKKKDNVSSFKDLSLGFSDILDKREEFFKDGFPYPTGLDKLDEKIGGINKGSVIVLGGRTTVGKSSIMTQIACHIASKNKKVLYITGEMTGQDLFDRIISNKTSVEAYKIKYGKADCIERGRIIKILSDGNFYNFPLKICFMPVMTLLGIKKVIEDVKPEIVFIDHIQLLSLEKSDTVAQSINEAMAELKRIAGEETIGVVVGSQLSRAIEHTSNKGKEYSNAYFKGSGGIEENADVAMKLELEEGEKKDNIDWNMILEITKNRYGRIGPVFIAFQRQYLRFIGRTV